MTTMKPPNRITLTKNGNDFDRVGDNTRNSRGELILFMESILDDIAPLPITCDVRPIHPPFFSEFFYADVFGGIKLMTLSAEVNARIVLEVIKDAAPRPFDLSTVFDKYDLQSFDGTYKKIIFLAGSNALNLMNQSLVHKLMNEGEDWFIKPHPVTSPETLRDIGLQYGYHRIIDRKVSGMALLRKAESVASTQCSELFLLARLLNKPVIDITRTERSWMATYNSICRLLDNSDQDIDLINRFFMNYNSGFLRADCDEAMNIDKAKTYFDLCMTEREKHRMITTQKLKVSEKTFMW